MTVKSAPGTSHLCPSSKRPCALVCYLYKERVLGVAVLRPTSALSLHLLLNFPGLLASSLSGRLSTLIRRVEMEVGRELSSADCCALTPGLPWDAQA